MGFYVSNHDLLFAEVRHVYWANRFGFGAKRIPRKVKKQLRNDWARGRSILADGYASHPRHHPWVRMMANDWANRETLGAGWLAASKANAAALAESWVMRRNGAAWF